MFLNNLGAWLAARTVMSTKEALALYNSAPKSLTAFSSGKLNNLIIKLSVDKAVSVKDMDLVIKDFKRRFDESLTESSRYYRLFAGWFIDNIDIEKLTLEEACECLAVFPATIDNRDGTDYLQRNSAFEEKLFNRIMELENPETV